MKIVQKGQYVGICLIVGCALGFSIGMILVNITYAPLYGGIGAGAGIVIGSMLRTYHLTKK